MLWRTLLLASLVVVSSLYGLLAATPYRSLPEATVLGARAQDACSILVAALLVALAPRSSLTAPARLLRLGLHGYLARRLRIGTGWMLLVTAVLFALLWLSTLLPYALGGAAPPDDVRGGGPQRPEGDVPGVPLSDRGDVDGVVLGAGLVSCPGSG